MIHDPKYFNKEDLYKQLGRIFDEFSKVIPYPNGHLTLHYRKMSILNVMKIKELIERFDLLGDNFFGYGINKISNGKREYCNLDLSEIEKTDELNKHHHYDNFHFLTFKVKDEYFFVNTFEMLVGKSEIKTEHIDKLHMSRFKSAGFATEGMKIFVSFYFDGLQFPVSFQIDPYLIDVYRYAKYYIDTIESLAIKKNVDTSSEVKIDTLNVSGGQVNIAGEVKEIK